MNAELLHVVVYFFHSRRLMLWTKGVATFASGKMAGGLDPSSGCDGP